MNEIPSAGKHLSSILCVIWKPSRSCLIRILMKEAALICINFIIGQLLEDYVFFTHVDFVVWVTSFLVIVWMFERRVKIFGLTSNPKLLMHSLYFVFGDILVSPMNCDS